MDINELNGWGISQQIAQIVENGFTFDEETGEEIHDECEWLTGKNKIADIMHATELDEVPGLEMSKKHQEVVDGDDDISSAVFEAEMMST